MNGWDILIGGAIALLLVLAFRTATSKKGRCCGVCCLCATKNKKYGPSRSNARPGRPPAGWGRTACIFRPFLIEYS